MYTWPWEAMDPSETVSPPPLVPDSESYTKARLVITRFISLYDHCKRHHLVADWNLSRPYGQRVDAAWYVDFGNKIEFWEWALPFTVQEGAILHGLSW